MASHPILLKAGMVVTMDPARRIITAGAVEVRDGRISAVLTPEELAASAPFTGQIVDVPDAVLIPGFIQTHIHLCQTLFRGLADDLPLLDWLRLRIFPFEAAHTARSMRASVWVGLAELIRSGTTTIMDMGSIGHEEEIVEAITASGVRAYVGKAMMDINDAYPRLREPTAAAVQSTLAQARLWHGAARGRISYAVAPRFVLSCTDSLMKDASDMTADFPGALFHTHAAENRLELEAVRQRCGADNIEHLGRLGVLRENTCLAHCVWVQDREMELLAERKVNVLHCPSSNLKLGSGVARIPEMLRRGISVSLGADGAPCNNTLNMFEEMRLAALLQKPAHGPHTLPAEDVFALATLGGARALGRHRDLGSIELGKRADLVLLDLRQVWNPSRLELPGDVYSSIVYSGSPANVRSVMIDGEWVYRDGSHVAIDEEEVLRTAHKELKSLLERVDYT